MANIIGTSCKRDIVERLIGMTTYREMWVPEDDPAYGILLGKGKPVRHIYRIEYEIENDKHLGNVEAFVAKFLGVEEPKGMRNWLGYGEERTSCFIAFDKFMQKNVNPDLYEYCLDSRPVYAGTKPRKADMVAALTRVLSWFDVYCLEHMRNRIYKLYTSFMASCRD